VIANAAGKILNTFKCLILNPKNCPAPSKEANRKLT
jgi:hypothetical protein